MLFPSFGCCCCCCLERTWCSSSLPSDAWRLEGCERGTRQLLVYL